MGRAKEVSLGLVVGTAAFFIYVAMYGIVAAYIPINYQKMTEGMAQEKAVLFIQAYQVFESFIAALPMAVAAYIFMFIFKFKASALFLISSLAVLLGSYFYAIYETDRAALNISFAFGVAMPCMLLWFSLSAPNKRLKQSALRTQDPQ